jgi:CRP/FNR family transcriptional regulator
LKKSTEEGKDLILSILQKGDLIGEIDGSEETLHSFSAEVIDPVEIGVIQKQDLRSSYIDLEIWRFNLSIGWN